MNTILFGDVGQTEVLERIRAGGLSLEVLADGSIRNVCYGQVELIRHLYISLRDSDWGNLIGTLQSVDCSEMEGTFGIQIQLEYLKEDIRFECWFSISVCPDRVYFSVIGKALSDFYRNRIGFCLLHPMEMAGSEVVVETEKGLRKSTFPTLIAPEDPFVDVKALTVNYKDLQAVYRFEGETFQTEDQRNWTDGSFKTFCTPLHLPYPVFVKQGTMVEQTISLTIHPQEGFLEELPSDICIRLKLSKERAGSLPSIGSCFPPLQRLMERREIDQLKRLQLKQYRFRIRSDGEHNKLIEHAKVVVEQLKSEVEVEAVVNPDWEGMTTLIETLQRLPALHRVSLYPLNRMNDITTRCPLSGASYRACQYVTSPSLIHNFNRIMLEHSLKPELGGGSRGNFAEFNRSHLPIEELDFIEFAINPQVHASDNRSIIETLPAQRTAAMTAKSNTGMNHVRIGSVTWKGQFNPYATDDLSVKLSEGRVGYPDSRHKSLFAAGWTLGSVAQLAAAGVSAVNLHECMGEIGLMSESGEDLYPLYYVMHDLCELDEPKLLSLIGTDPYRCAALAMSAGNKVRILLANLLNESIPIDLDMNEIPYAMAESRIMDETNYWSLVKDFETWENSIKAHPYAEHIQLELSPFAYCRIDLTLSM